MSICGFAQDTTENQQLASKPRLVIIGSGWGVRLVYLDARDQIAHGRITRQCLF